MNDYAFKFHSSERLITKPREFVEYKQALNETRVPVAPGVDVLLAGTDWNTGVPELRIDVFSKDCSPQLKGLFICSSVRGMLKEKYSRVVNIKFPITGAHIDLATWCYNIGNMTTIQHKYFELVSKVVRPNYSRR